MNRTDALCMAEAQREKLMQLGCHEWYCVDPISGDTFSGGASHQEWSASTMITAIRDVHTHYSTDNHTN
jgi:hypothetical protein